VLGKLEIPVAFYQHLRTQECADIFLSINTEQKPVQRSLVFDLYDGASANVVDPAADSNAVSLICSRTTFRSPHAGRFEMAAVCP